MTDDKNIIEEGGGVGRGQKGRGRESNIPPHTRVMSGTGIFISTDNNASN